MRDSEVIQWLFDSEALTRAFNFPVSVDRLIAAKRGIDQAVARKAPVATVAAEYTAFANAIGPTVMNAVLECEDAFLEVNHSDAMPVTPTGKQCLYIDPKGGRLLVQLAKEWGMVPRFTVEQEHLATG